MLRTAALDIITALGVEGGCNCQFALNPESFEYAVIEVNPRASRSSALASKTTGYPIAKVATKIAIGYNLDEIINAVTGSTFAAFAATPYVNCIYGRPESGAENKALQIIGKSDKQRVLVLGSGPIRIGQGMCRPSARFMRRAGRMPSLCWKAERSTTLYRPPQEAAIRPETA